jgi:hypothetical protein
MFMGVVLLAALLLLAGCGGGSTAISGSASSNAGNAQTSDSSAAPASGGQQSAQSSTGKSASVDSQQYLIKTLKISMQVNDPRSAADDLQSWIATNDPRSTSAGADYEQYGSSFTISLSFSIEASLYQQIERYVRDYASKHGGQLTALTEAVQDVTNDYVDSQSRLANLRVEQTRLQDLLTHTQTLSDIITVQDKLTDIEGQIETIEAHLNALTGQVKYYTITINIQPISSETPAPQAQSGWNFAQILHDAFAASLTFAQNVLAFLVWLFAFLIYLVPVAIIAFFVRRWRRRAPAAPAPKAPRPPMPPAGDD